jgi:hypothetical protein
MKNKGLLFYAVVTVAVVLAIGTIAYAYTMSQNINVAGNYYYQGGTPSEDVSLGGATGNTFEQTVEFHKNFINGGNRLNASSTLTIARAITAGEIANSRLITVNSGAVAGTLSAASLDLTLAATSTLWSFLKNDGDEYTFDFVNQSPTAATTTQIVAGTGCQLINAYGDSTIPGQKGATVVIKRITDWLADGGSKDCIVWVYEWN